MRDARATKRLVQGSKDDGGSAPLLFHVESSARHLTSGSGTIGQRPSIVRHTETRADLLSRGTRGAINIRVSNTSLTRARRAFRWGHACSGLLSLLFEWQFFDCGRFLNEILELAGVSVIRKGRDAWLSLRLRIGRFGSNTILSLMGA